MKKNPLAIAFLIGIIVGGFVSVDAMRFETAYASKAAIGILTLDTASNSTSSETTESTDQTGSIVLSELEIQEIVIATLIVIIIVLFIIIIWMQRKSQAQNENTAQQHTK